MTTATKEQSPSAELRKLTAKREQAHEKLHELKAKLQAWDMEGLPPDIRPGTAQADLHAANREREDGPNPHRQNYDAAEREFHAADVACREFRWHRIHDRLAELDADHRAAEEAIRSGFESVARGCEQEAVIIEEARAIIVSTDGIDGQAFTHDPRPHEWLKLARQALDSEIAKPGLTELGAWKVDRQ